MWHHPGKRLWYCNMIYHSGKWVLLLKCDIIDGKWVSYCNVTSPREVIMVLQYDISLREMSIAIKLWYITWGNEYYHWNVSSARWSEYHSAMWYHRREVSWLSFCSTVLLSGCERQPAICPLCVDHQFIVGSCQIYFLLNNNGNL